MMEKNSGGPAFPGLHPSKECHYSEEGMTLRDYFAAKAMQGMLSNPKLAKEILDHGGAFGGWIEESAFSWADAMLKARGK